MYQLIEFIKSSVSWKLASGLSAVAVLVAGLVYLPLQSSKASSDNAAPANGPGYLMLTSADWSEPNVLVKPGPGVWNFAPLHLPQGAKITRITAYFSASEPITFTTHISIGREIYFDNVWLGGITLAPEIKPGNQMQSTPLSGALPIIDNSQYGYIVSVATECLDKTDSCKPDYPPSSGVARLFLYQIRLDYTFDAFVPNVNR